MASKSKVFWVISSGIWLATRRTGVRPEKKLHSYIFWFLHLFCGLVDNITKPYHTIQYINARGNKATYIGYSVICSTIKYLLEWNKKRIWKRNKVVKRIEGDQNTRNRVTAGPNNPLFYLSNSPLGQCSNSNRFAFPSTATHQGWKEPLHLIQKEIQKCVSSNPVR